MRVTIAAILAIWSAAGLVFAQTTSQTTNQTNQATTPPAAVAPAQVPPAAPATSPTTPAPTAPTNVPAAPAQVSPGATPEGANNGVNPPADAEEPPSDPSAADSSGEDDVSIGDIPDVEVIELKPDVSRKALDAYVLVREKYKDENLEDYESFPEFVAKSPRGKDFEADVKAAGFSSLSEWYTVITNMTFAYANLINDQTADLKQQIEEIKSDATMAQDMKDRMIKAVSAMIPSDNNRRVVDEMTKDAAYAEKIKILETESETE